jgi:rubrerythrin
MHVEQPLTESGDIQTTEVRRGVLLKRVTITLGGIIGGGSAAAGIADASRNHANHGGGTSLSARDREILEFALRLEHLQVAFYAEAIRRGKLTGEAKQFAQVVGGEENEHLKYFDRVLGSSNAKPGSFKFGDATAGDKQFVKAAAKIEDTGIAAYNGQAENVSRHTLESVARVISVEARHAAWARSLAGQIPAPVPADQPISAAQALDAIKPYLA